MRAGSVFWLYLDCHVCVLSLCTVVKRAVGTITQPQPREGGAGSAGRVPSVSWLLGVLVTVLE